MNIEFWTSTEYGGFMESLMEALRERGHSAEQRFLISEASYRAARSKPARLWLRVRQYLLYPGYLKVCLLFGRSRKADVLVVSTNTFYAPLIATFLHKRVVHLVYDLFPEAIRGEAALECASAARNERSLRLRSRDTPGPLCPKAEALVVPPDASALQGGFAAKSIRKIVSLTLKRAETNVFLGDHLRDYVCSIYEEVNNPVVIPVGASAFGNEEDGRSEMEDGESRRAAGDGGAEVGRRGGLLQDRKKEAPAKQALPPQGGSKLPHSKDTACHTPNSPISQFPYSPIVLLYCGNLGRMHDLETLKAFWEAAEPQEMEDRRWKIEDGRSEMEEGGRPPPSDLQPPNSELRSPISAASTRFLFHCSGPKKPELEAAVAGLPEEVRSMIEIKGGLGGAEWEEVMRASQVALVTMVPGAEKVVMPSKTYSAMMAGQAILAVCPVDSDLADLVREADCGWQIEPGDVHALFSLFSRLPDGQNEIATKRENARQYAEKHLRQDVLATDWIKVFEEIGT